jgi:hypothetical protein
VSNKGYFPWKKKVLTYFEVRHPRCVSNHSIYSGTKRS